MLSWTKRLIKEISDSAMLYHGKQAHKQVFWLCFSSLGLPVPPRCLKSKASLQCLHRAPSIKTSKPNLYNLGAPKAQLNSLLYYTTVLRLYCCTTTVLLLTNCTSF